mmetsp:Transcript_14224/g.44775  ORF Transcript_14224/g.44775 Transcript_14224/m.44775 type:complete len:85 (-) Transcript_14224:473-727(-)
MVGRTANKLRSAPLPAAVDADTDVARLRVRPAAVANAPVALDTLTELARVRTRLTLPALVDRERRKSRSSVDRRLLLLPLSRSA